MIFIGCGECGGKYQIIEGRFGTPRCPSCGTELPEKIRTCLRSLLEEVRNRPNWKVFFDMGNQFNVEVTLTHKP
ncbi:MAG: hypothetical protein ACOY31_04315 [Bacillota bacterium]